MPAKPVLIVDDEKNIRLTVSIALESLGLASDSAMNGEEALQLIREKDYRLALLDLKMPGMDGMEVLRRLRDIRPDIRVIIITAHGTIESAVEAMKLGAVDFIQKPFAPKEIRDLVTSVLDRELLDERQAADYASHFELAKRCIAEHQFEAAAEHARQAVTYDNGRPEAFNLLGVLREMDHDIVEAQKYYRAALALDSTYQPAKKNLERTANWRRDEAIIIGEIRGKERER